MYPRSLLIALSAAAVVLFSCGSRLENATAANQQAPYAVKVLSLSEAEAPDTYTAPGTVRAKTTSALSSKVVAYVQAVRVREGDRVRAGQALVVLEAQDLDARYKGAQSAREEAGRSIEEAESASAEAKTNLEITEITYNRLKDLFEKRSISNQEFDEASAKLKSARASYDSARARREQAQSRAGEMDAELRSAEITRGYATVSAPFSGVIISSSVDPGVLAAPGMPLLTLEQEGNYRLEASVEESRLASIHIRDRVPVQIDALKRNISGVVAEVAPVVDAASRTYTVKIDLPTVAGLHSGLFGRALFPSGSKHTLLLPSDAIVQNGDLASVLVAENGFARRRLITTGIEADGKTAVLSGLRSGDALIYPIPQQLQDGMRVEVLP